MAGKPPAFQWYPKDADTDENIRMMDDAEYGFYGRCLNHSWVNEGLPGTIEDIARVLQRPLAVAKKRWERVGRCFELVDGRYRNPRQERDRAGCKAFSDARKDAADKRWNAYALQKQCSALASASAVINTPAESVREAIETLKTRTPIQEIEDWFEVEFWPSWVKAGNDSKRAALKWAKAKAKTKTLREQITAGSKAQAAARLAREPQYRKHASTWLNESAWLDDPNETVLFAQSNGKLHDPSNTEYRD